MRIFEGSMAALVTPFKEAPGLKPEIDEKSLRELVEWQIAEGTDVLVPCGTTGESATLDYEEHDRVIRIVVEQTRGRIPVLAGTGSNSTVEAIEITRRAQESGADGSLQVAPYYNKPTQEGLYRHFKAVADAADLPIVLYNVPGRTVVNLLPETVARLAELKNVVGIKEACGQLDQIRKLIGLCGSDLTVLSGEDAQNYDILEMGGRGMISVTANVVPKTLSEMWDAFASGDRNEANKAKDIQERLQPLHAAMFFETNPIPVKTALGFMKRCSSRMRLPLCEMGGENTARLKGVLKEFKLL
jgi:4-hydroxy-tetrahydrodipicolinate synthase